jgi:hypothetical protein
LIWLNSPYHHIGDRAAYFRQLRGMLRPNGRVAIIDFRLDSPHGPPTHEHGFLPYQYFLVFVPAACSAGRAARRARSP